MMRRTVVILGAVVLLAVVLQPPTHAQDQWSWPERPENLQVLPKDWPGSRLRAPMTGFTRALGVRCSHCHVGEEGQPLSTYDFASDDNPNKNRAREMLRMLGSINDHLEKIEVSGEDRVNMWCHTCHRGRPRPMTLQEELTESYKTEGLEAALLHYANLKEDFFGRGAFDFGEGALNGFGYHLLQNGDTAGAIRFFETNTRAFSESANVWDSLAEAHMKAGNMEMAKKYFQQSLEINPENQNVKDMLEKIESGE